MWIERGLFSILLAVVVLAGSVPRLFQPVWAVYVDGQPIVAMRSREELNSVLEQVRKTEAEGAPAEWKQQVKIDRGHGKLEASDAATATRKLGELLSVRAERGVIYVDSLPVVALPSEGDARKLLEEIQSEYAAGLAEMSAAPQFRQAVEVRREMAEEDVWADAETARALLTGKNTGEERSHTVARGDNAWSICEKYELSLEELKKQNPGVNPVRLRVGQKLLIGGLPEPLVTVLTEGEQSEVLPTSFPVVRQASPQMFVGKQVLKSPGRPGTQKVVYRVRCENGKVVHRDVVSRSPLTPAKPRIVAVGTKPRQAAVVKAPQRRTRAYSYNRYRRSYRRRR